MKLKVTKGFYDKKDNRYHYFIGNSYPRQGLEASEERIAELVKGGYLEAPKPKKPKVEKPKKEKAEKPKK